MTNQTNKMEKLEEILVKKDKWKRKTVLIGNENPCLKSISGLFKNYGIRINREYEDYSRIDTYMLETKYGPFIAQIDEMSSGIYEIELHYHYKTPEEEKEIKNLFKSKKTNYCNEKYKGCDTGSGTYATLDPDRNAS